MSEKSSEPLDRNPKRRLLLVEDNPITAMAYKKMLQREGFEVLHIAAGNEAFAAIRDQKFDLVLLDLMLPEIDGVEILRRNQAQNHDFKTPVVVISDVDLGVVREEVRRYGVKQFFTKTGADAQKILQSIKNLTGMPEKPQVPALKVQLSDTLSEALRMVPTPTLENRKISEVVPDCLETSQAGQSPDTKETNGSRRRFLFVW